VRVSDKCKNNFQFKTVCNGDMAYVTQLKPQKNQKCAYKTPARVDNFAKY